MKTSVLAGVVLIVLGGLALAYTTFSFTHPKKVAELGSIVIVADKTETVAIPPLVGGLAIVIGVGLLIAGNRSKA